MENEVIRVGIFDQIVSGGGVRLFTTKLLEEFSRSAGTRWHFHLMWPLFDSSNNYLPPFRLPNVSFERINVGTDSRVRKTLVPALNRVRDSRALPRKSRDHLKDYQQKLCEEEQRKLRLGDGRGLQWLNERMNAFDLLYMPYPYLTLPGSEHWQPHVPVVITLHDLAHEHTDTWGEVTAPLRHEVRRWTQISDLIIFSSDFVMHQAQKIYELPPTRTKRIYLSPDKRNESVRQSDALRRYGLTEGYIFTLGWAAKHKRVETLIEGFALFRKKSNVNVPLVFAGPSTENLLRSDTHGLKIGEDLFALGYVRDDDIAALYKSSSLVVTASISEAGFNTMIFDAMNVGKPLLCSNIPQFVERLGTDDSLALTFDPHSPQSLCDALMKHFGDPQQAQLRVENAQRFIASRRLADVGQDYLEAFESVL
ncbi:MAG: glycosyltransferase [Pyrinomonadaceae bacterium]|nr:glycosyltransferase [Pyrinomonadaceae bacterium]